MATYDGTFQVIDGKKKPTTRARRVGRAVRDRLRSLAVQQLKLACRLQELAGRLGRLTRDDFGRTADDLTRLAGGLERLARDDFTRTARDFTSIARDLVELAAKLQPLARDGLTSASRLLSSAARDLRWFAAGLLRLAWNWLTSTSRLLLTLARKLGAVIRNEFRRTAENLASLARTVKRLIRDDLYRTVSDLVSLASMLAAIARDDFTRTARDVTSLADWLANFARDDVRRTVEDLKRLAVHSTAIAYRLAALSRRLLMLASRRLKMLAGQMEQKAGDLKIWTHGRLREAVDLSRRLAALSGQLFDRLGQAARSMQASTAHELGRLGATARAGAELGRKAGDRLWWLVYRGRTLASFPADLTHRVAQSGRHHYRELAGYLGGRADERRQAAVLRARLEADERRVKRQRAEDEAMQKMAERQATLEIAREQAGKKLAVLEAQKIEAREAKLKRAEQQKEAALARKNAADEARAASAPAPQQGVAPTRRPREEPVDRPRRVLILVENLPSPFDRRVWQEANALRDAGYLVSIICPTGKGYEKKFEDIGGIHIWRYDLPFEANGALGYVAEYATALTRTWMLSWRVFFGRGFDAVHACNPPDLLFLIGGFFKLFGRKFLFDHHDINPELYEAKFGRRDFFYRLLLRFERWSFRAADVSIATNESYRRIAIERGGMPAERVFVVRSGPSLERMKIVPPDERLKRGRRHLVGYVGVMGKQEGIDCLLRAVRLIVCRHGRTDIHFGLVGGGTSLEEMKALAQRLDIADYVTFTGRVPDAELLTMLNTAEVCVNPDIASEMNDKSTMNKIMEYMALGKPIVQFDLTEGRYSARGAALHARRGDIADFAARILELIDNPELRQRMGAAGRERVLNALSWDHEVPKLLAAYESLWEGGKDTAAQEAGAAMATLGARSAAPPVSTP